ncbi:MAG: hypothetical protein AAGN66_29530, partial [Acidobacteriota bacterium]
MSLRVRLGADVMFRRLEANPEAHGPPPAILEAINSEYPKFNRSPITQKELEIILEELKDLRCIEQIDRDSWKIKDKGETTLIS